jgi:hypothetical protein
MDRLPQELIDKIASYLDRYRDEEEEKRKEYDWIGEPKQSVQSSSVLPDYATLSNQWRKAVETITFQSLIVGSDELNEFKSIVTDDRRRHVARLSYRLVPEDDEQARTIRDATSEEKKSLFEKVINQPLSELFSILKAWEVEGIQTPLHLRFSTQHLFLSYTDLDVESSCYDDTGTNHFGENMIGHKSKSLRPFQIGPLPNLLNVKYLQIQYSCSRGLGPSIGPQIAALLPNLNGIEWTVPGYHGSATRRRVYRASLLEALELLQSLHRLKEAYIAMALTYFEADTSPPQNSVILLGQSYDLLNSALRTFSQHLTVLDLCADVDATCFWPSGDEPSPEIPLWPFLKTLDVSLSGKTPSCRVYFTDSLHANAVEMNALFSAVSKAVKRMPVLEQLKVSAHFRSDREFRVSYYAPGVVQEGDKKQGTDDGFGRITESDDDIKSRRVYYEIGELWRPNDEILEGLRGAGREKFGEEIIEKFLGIRVWRPANESWGL